MKTAYIAKQRQISFVKSHFSRQLEERLGLIEVQAPILSRVGDGTQDNLSGCEKAVQVKVKALPDAQFEVVHSLGKDSLRLVSTVLVSVYRTLILRF